ncbi:hypothetical protein ACIF80_37250 [Streptomyces sp. NPDC085927]|uniref:hypothetical protein n=1 Tax=Streptomyces sp. NPDC085927 TaxID=3365738 RepID=UPI0037D8C965
MRAVLETRHKAAAVRVEELEAELERVRAALVDAEEVLRCRVIGLAQYLEAGADGLGARRAAVVLGWDSALASRVEGARARLKRLVERGWLVEEKPGRFTLPAPEQSPGAGRPGDDS